MAVRLKTETILVLLASITHLCFSNWTTAQPIHRETIVTSSYYLTDNACQCDRSYLCSDMFIVRCRTCSLQEPNFIKTVSMSTATNAKQVATLNSSYGNCSLDGYGKQHFKKVECRVTRQGTVTVGEYQLWTLSAAQIKDFRNSSWSCRGLFVRSDNTITSFNKNPNSRACYNGNDSFYCNENVTPAQTSAVQDSQELPFFNPRNLAFDEDSSGTLNCSTPFDISQGVLEMIVFQEKGSPLKTKGKGTVSLTLKKPLSDWHNATVHCNVVDASGMNVSGTLRVHYVKRLAEEPKSVDTSWQEVNLDCSKDISSYPDASFKWENDYSQTTERIYVLRQRTLATVKCTATNERTLKSVSITYHSNYSQLAIVLATSILFIVPFIMTSFCLCWRKRSTNERFCSWTLRRRDPPETHSERAAGFGYKLLTNGSGNARTLPKVEEGATTETAESQC